MSLLLMTASLTLYLAFVILLAWYVVGLTTFFLFLVRHQIHKQRQDFFKGKVNPGKISRRGDVDNALLCCHDRTAPTKHPSSHGKPKMKISYYYEALETFYRRCTKIYEKGVGALPWTPKKRACIVQLCKETILQQYILVHCFDFCFSNVKCNRCGFTSQGVWHKFFCYTCLGPSLDRGYPPFIIILLLSCHLDQKQARR